jgi:NADH-quinone oxidoreductase subunit M
MSGVPILSILVGLPLIAGIIALFQSPDGARWNALVTTLVSLALGILLWSAYDPDGAQWQFVEYAKLGGGVAWAMGIDGIALMLIMLTLFLMPICIGASWRAIDKRVPEYMASFLLMQSLMIGVFTAQDLLLFYIFFEGGLIPMYLIIGIWGGGERIKASYKFFLYTLLGSVVMLIAMLAMIWTSGTTSIPELMAYDFDPSLQWWLWLAFFASFAVKMPM